MVSIMSVSMLLAGCNANNNNSKKEVEWNAPTYNWSADNLSCTAERVSSTDDTIRETETVDSSYSVITTPKCESNGLGKYTAVFTNSAFKTQTKNTPIDAIGHNWGEPNYTWSVDFTTCEAVRTCQNDLNHKQTETANSTYEVIDEPDYDNDGLGRYTVVFTNSAFTIQRYDVVLTKLEKLVFTNHDTYYSVKADSANISGNIAIPSEYDGLPVTTIEASAFVNCSLVSSVQLPDTIISVGESAFAGCSSLSSINIPGSVNGLYGYCFYGCSSLQTITIGDGVGFIGTRSGSFCFRNCISLETIIFPDSVTLVGYAAFMGCSSLKNVRWPESDLEICGSAFINCSSLKTSPSRASEIGNSAFVGCHSLTDVFVPAAYCGSGIFAGCKSIKKAVFAEGTKTIPDNIFNDCTALTQIIISSTVTSLGQLPFVFCTQLHEVINKSTLELNKTDEAFVGCDNLEYIISNDSYSKLSTLEGITYYIKTNGYILFVDYNNKECATLTIPSYITQIGSAALYNFDKLETLNYEGTKEQWNSMDKGSDWNEGVPATVVHCSDGDVNL